MIVLLINKIKKQKQKEEQRREQNTNNYNNKLLFQLFIITNNKIRNDDDILVVYDDDDEGKEESSRNGWRFGGIWDCSAAAARRIEDANITINLFCNDFEIDASTCNNIGVVSRPATCLYCNTSTFEVCHQSRCLAGQTTSGFQSLCHPHGMQATYQQALHQAGKGPCISITL